MKSLSETHPFAGCASAPVDVQWYVDGSGQLPPVGVVDGEVDGVVDGVVGGVLVGVVGVVLGVLGLPVPVQVVPLRVKVVGVGLVLFQVALKPMLVLAPVLREPL